MLPLNTVPKFGKSLLIPTQLEVFIVITEVTRNVSLKSSCIFKLVMYLLEFHCIYNCFPLSSIQIDLATEASNESERVKGETQERVMSSTKEAINR